MTIDVERIRFRGEHEYAAALRQLPGIDELARKAIPDPARVRRTLLARSLQLSEGMAPAPHRVVRELASRFGITEPVEIYQASGAENASIHLVTSPVLVEIQGRMLSLLDDDTLAALLGHEIGHYLAHGPGSSELGPSLAATIILHSSEAPEELFRAAQRMSMARELTADRFGLLSCSGLDAALRLEMVVVTGLAAENLTWDTAAYLSQSRELMEATLAEGDTALGTSHPEHSLRTWALWLFSETEVYKELTGLGPGTRRLSDVDDLLVTVLGMPELELGIATVLEEPPVEVHECALAACILVASADGEIHDSELQVIERVFAPLVAHWRDRLDPENALSEFQRLAPLVTAGGPRLQRALFSLLVHVLAADGECDPAEVSQILAIGGALGCRKLFLALLPSVLSHFEIDLLEVTAHPERSIPMPARGSEAKEALSVYFQGVVKRGGGVVTLRRLLRIAGTQRTTEEALLTIVESLRDAGLLVDPELGTELDAIHRLTLVDAPVQAGIEVAPPPLDGSGEARGRLRRGLSRLRDKLISGDGRSPSIRLQVCRPGRSLDLSSLDEISIGLSERTLALIRGGKRARIVDAAEAGAHEGARRISQALVQLERERFTRYEETGADDLNIGYPFITGLAGGYLFRAPLILFPVRIERAVRGAGAFWLAAPAGSTPVANQSALRLIFHRKGFTYPDDLAERADELAASGPEALLAELSTIGLGTVGTLGELNPFRDRTDELAEWRDDRLEIEECAVLGLFPQSSSDLLQDYDELLTALDAGVPPPALLASAREVLPASLKQSLGVNPRESAPPVLEAAVPVLYADPVQQSVLEAARTSEALVVDGPPGTGKSQVIVNLVADALSRGQKVAVVCEKRAALDVVAQRLGSVGLRHLLAVVHDVQEDRRPLYAQVVSRFENRVAHTDDASRRAAIRSELKALTEKLRNRAAVLTKEEGGMALGALHTYASGMTVGESCQLEALAGLPVSRCDRLAKQISALFPYAGFWRAGSPWRSPDNGGGPQRASFAAFDNEKARSLLSAIVAAREAALGFQQAKAGAGLPAEEEVHARLVEAEATLAELIRTRAARSDEVGRDAFLSLLGERVERRPEDVERTQQAWLGLVESRTLWGRDGNERLLSSLVAMQLSRSGETEEIRNLARQMTESRQALEMFSAPVRFAMDPMLEAALADAGARCTSPFRFLSPAWWRAGKTIRASLAAQWPEKAGMPVDQALILAIRARAEAAKFWLSLSTMQERLSPGSGARSFGEAKTWIESCLALLATANAIASSREGLQALGLWRAVPDAATLREWDGYAEFFIEWQRRAKQLLPAVRELRAQSALLGTLGAWPRRFAPGVIEDWEQRLDLLQASLTALKSLAGATQPLRKLLPWLPPLPRVDSLASLADAWRRDASRLVTADRLVAAARELEPSAAVFPSYLASRSDLTHPVSWADAVRTSWARAQISAIETREPDVFAADELEGGVLDGEEGRLKALHDEERRLAVEAILARQDHVALMAAPQAEKGARRTQEQATREAILKEAKKQRNILPLRGFVRRFIDQGLLDVLPVWLLSPETAATLFPRAPVFDLVIFDEASQCTVESGLPVLMRAQRAVIAGDERQMPPSNFFKSSGEEESAEEVNEAREMFDAESLLVLARHRTRHMGLSWHYRCQHEELIAFSNHAIYGGSLNTIPSTVSRLGEAAVHWIEVPGGQYEAGANAPEAAAVIDLVERLLGQASPPSVGVVTFNLSQRRAILDEIDRRVAASTVFADLWGKANALDRVDDRPFIKNLETVQGDEREVIIFSLGHAPIERTKRDGKKELYVPARFGPLGQRGGERRLNVAVSRARKEIYVVASFDPNLLSVARSKNEGPRLFKGFLQYARELSLGQRNQASQTLKLLALAPARTTDGETERLPESWVPLNAQLALALEELGITCEMDVGTSGFRVPLAVVDRANPGRYVLGVLFDEDESPEAVFERHVHVPNVLSSRGWRLRRVSSREWDIRRDEVLSTIQDSIV